MSLIIRNSPETKNNKLFFGFPNRYKRLSGNKFSAHINKSLASLPVDNKALIKLFCKHLAKQNKDCWEFYDYDDRMEKKTLKGLHAIATDITKTDGDCLISAFVDTNIQRGTDVKTSIVDNCLTGEIKDSPTNIAYDKDILAPDFFSKRQTVVQECIFSVEHATREDKPFFPCESCGGTGWVKCPNCEGTGREQYEDGQFATGIQKIKTVQCSECGGRGKIPCHNCGGSGQVEIYAPEYSIVKSVEEKMTQTLQCFATLPDDEVRKLNGLDKYTLLNHQMRNIVNSQGALSFSKKNVNTVAVDNQAEIQSKLEEAGFGWAYEKLIREIGKPNTISNKNVADIAARKELHYIFPVSILEFKYGSNNGVFIYYEQESRTVVHLLGLDSIGGIKRFFLKVAALFKK